MFTMGKQFLLVFLLIVMGISRNEDEPFNDVSSLVQEFVSIQTRVQPDVSQMRQQIVKHTKGHIENPMGVLEKYPVDMEEPINNYSATRTHAAHMEATASITMTQMQAANTKNPFPPGNGILHRPRFIFPDHLKESSLSPKSRHIIIGFVAAVIFLVIVKNIVHLVTQNVGVPKASLLQGFSMLFDFLCCMNTSAVIPHSYFLVGQLEYGPLVSGILISAPSSVGLFGALVARRYSLDWDQERNRKILVVACFCFALTTALFAIAANPPTWLHASRQACMTVLLLSRIASGLCTYIPSLLKMMVQKILPEKDLVTFNVHWTIAVSLGLGSGPLLATLADCTSHGKNDKLDAAITMWYITGMMFMLGITLAVVIPRDISNLISIKETQDAECQDNETLSGSNGSDKTTAKKWIWLHGCWFNFERALIVTGVEAGAAMVFEVEFLLNTSDTGLVLSFVFVILLPLSWIFQDVKAKGLVTTQTLLLAMTAVVSVAVIFMFTELSNKWSFIWALAFIFPCAYVANGCATGLAMLHSMPGTFYCQENMMLAQCLMICLGRFLGAPVSRALIGSARNKFVIFQLCLAGISVLGAIRLRRWVNEVETDSSGEGSICESQNTRKSGLFWYLSFLPLEVWTCTRAAI